MSEKTPSIEELYVMSVQSALEAAHALNLTREQFMTMLETAWDIDNDRREQEKSNT
jgi:hypothetical protein